MQVSNGDIWQAQPALGELLKEKLPVKTAYWLAKLGRKLGERYRDISQVHDKIIQQYGEPNDKGNIEVKPDSPHRAECIAAITELMETEEDFPIDKITLPSDNGLCVSAATLLVLEPFVEVA